MKTNLGMIDRVARVIIGVILIVAPFVSGMALFENGVATAVSVIAGVVMLATSAMKFCPIYGILGWRTGRD